MSITVTCPSCQQKCAVQDEHAGLKVGCPKCGKPIDVPKADLPGADPAPAAGGASAGNFMGNLDKSIQALGLDPLSTKLLYGGLSSLALLFLATFLPWFNLGGIASVLGVSWSMGILSMLLTLGAAGFIGAVLFGLLKPNLFDISLYVGAGWAALSALWRLVNVFQLGGFSGFGLYIALLASLGAAGCLGYLVFNKLMKKK